MPAIFFGVEKSTFFQPITFKTDTSKKKIFFNVNLNFFKCFAYCLEYVYHDSITITSIANIYILVIVLIFTIFRNGSSGYQFLNKDNDDYHYQHQ